MLCEGMDATLGMCFCHTSALFFYLLFNVPPGRWRVVKETKEKSYVKQSKVAQFYAYGIFHDKLNKLSFYLNYYKGSHEDIKVLIKIQKDEASPL